MQEQILEKQKIKIYAKSATCLVALIDLPCMDVSTRRTRDPSHFLSLF